MNSKVFERALFQAKNKPTKDADSGITQGFDEEGPQEDQMKDDELMEDVSRRSPTSPEILMNNLRGDVRSVDARYQELADMLGEQVASETPPEVLAMLQSKFAAEQAPSGIGALPPGQGMAPPPSMPPGAGAPMPTPPGGPQGGPPQPPQMPPDMPMPPQASQGMPPQGFAQGGIASLPQTGATYSRGIGYNGPEMETSAIVEQGRHGDTILAHLTPQQHQLLSSMGGGSTTNPKTGLPEHFLASAGPLLQNIAQRATPMVQAANTWGGRLMNPVLTKPTLEQGRSTLGTFMPRTAEGLEMAYPTVTQRLGAATEPMRQAIANAPATAKMGAALTAIPGGAAVMNAMGQGQTTPGMPMRNDGTDVPLPITRDSTGNPVFNQPPVPVGKGPLGLTPGESAVTPPSLVEEAMNPPTGPTSVEDLMTKQTGTPSEKKTLENRLDTYMKENLPVFEKYMGSNKEDTQIQALLLLADAGLQYATTGARSPMMALANAAKGLPGGLGQLAAQESARKSQIAGAALTSGLQTLAAEDKAAASLQKALIEKLSKSGELTTEDLGAGRTLYRNKQTGAPAGPPVVDPSISGAFLSSSFTPQVVNDDKGNPVGFESPYVTIKPKTQSIVYGKQAADNLEKEKSNLEFAIQSMDRTLGDIQGAYGPRSAISKLNNNIFVPVVPFSLTSPNLMAVEKKTKINSSIASAVKAVARTGDTGNIAVAEQNAARQLFGTDKPGDFFADPEINLKSFLTMRTELANRRLAIGSQLGYINQDVELSVPNMGTKNDPIPLQYFSYIKKQAGDNPTGSIYVKTPEGAITQISLSENIKQ